ncbi:Oidioi.mRNA.OKI2018_I69.XSR.g14308.t1.cds [Oikopleura dioica]|uniref:Oidioi.mRNA.OKI2018_I69.XSR.g14308.t1.cds n=1 Tax=Oikopleura dioica TaxID=34765 RepID=A0ABN7S9H7_OIKDI|nr:Oidioi.mRNA.OKI2018_I69.XSR.g14308.t1.cds [Oikopleura dioica]
MLKSLRKFLFPPNNPAVENEETQPGGNNNRNLQAEVDSLRWQLDQMRSKISALQEGLNKKILAEEAYEEKIELLQRKNEELRFRNEMLQDRLE